MTLNELREELDRLYGLPPSPLVEREIQNLSLLYHRLTKGDRKQGSIRISISQPVGGDEHDDQDQARLPELRGAK